MWAFGVLATVPCVVPRELQREGLCSGPVDMVLKDGGVGSLRVPTKELAH